MYLPVGSFINWKKESWLKSSPSLCNASMSIIPHRKYLSWSLQCVIISNYEYAHRICSSQDALVHLLFMYYTLNFTYSFRNISADVHLCSKTTENEKLRCVMWLLGKNEAALASSFSIIGRIVPIVLSKLLSLWGQGRITQGKADCNLVGEGTV